MHWNYRVVKDKTLSGTTFYRVAEVYYDEDGCPTSYSEGSTHLNFAELVEDLKWKIDKIDKALDKPVLVWDDELGKLVEVDEGARPDVDVERPGVEFVEGR